jgi:taurine--2-oxoglutarate transaminase
MLPPAALAEVAAACKDAGLLPFTNTNRVHLVPPCTTSDEEAREGLAILDEALKAGDAHVAG